MTLVRTLSSLSFRICCFVFLLLPGISVFAEEKTQLIENLRIELDGKLWEIKLLKQVVSYEGFDPNTYIPKDGGPVFSPDMAFVVTASMLTGEDTRVIGYVPFREKGYQPASIWSARLLRLEESEKLILVTSESNTLDLNLGVYELNLRQPIASYPLELRFTDMSNWPKRIEPTDTLRTMLQTNQICGIKTVRILQEPDSLLIYGEPYEGNCTPEYYRFHMGSKLWTEVKLQESEPITVGPNGAPIYPKTWCVEHPDHGICKEQVKQ